MEKPRKLIHGDNCQQPWCRCEDVNRTIDAMSAWIEGEIPSVDEIAKLLFDLFNKDDEIFDWRELIIFATAIHALITRKLTGKV